MSKSKIEIREDVTAQELVSIVDGIAKDVHTDIEKKKNPTL